MIIGRMTAFLNRFVTAMTRDPKKKRISEAGLHEGICMELGACPICGEAVLCHEFAALASSPWAERERIYRLFDRREWTELSRLDTWEGSEDNLVLYMMKCPEGGVVPFELSDPVSFYSWPHVWKIHSPVGNGSDELETALRWRVTDF